jgi:hypothetical protein
MIPTIPRLQGPFKVCSFCAHTWNSRDDFLADATVVPIGYMVNFVEPEAGLFQFNHKSCQTTLAVRACFFTDLHTEPVFSTRQTESPECPGYCLHRDNLRPCAAHCECAYVRNVLGRIAVWPKALAPLPVHVPEAHLAACFA